LSSWKIFAYAYAGFLLPIVPLMCLGAASALAASSVANAAWGEAFETSGVGGLLLAMLGPVHGFGKFLTVLLALSVTANVAPTFYSFGLSFQVFVPWAVRVPRYLFSLLATAMYVVYKHACMDWQS
jgi:purine-cytosine permease-like protein